VLKAPCPDDAALRQFLEATDATADPGVASIADHIEECARCQATLNCLLASGSPTRHTAPPVDVSYLDRIKTIDVAILTPIPNPCIRDPELDSPVPESPSRLVIPNYELLEEVGRGGMGVVFRARHRLIGRDVAVKMLREDYLAEADRARLMAEAETVARLQHPNIAQLYEVGEVSGRPFLVFEYLSGGTLSQRLNGVPQPPLPTAALVETIARAVHAAHQHHIVHRDLKPANVILVPDDRSPYGLPKLIDFGLAKRFDAEPTGSTRSVSGTPAYMAPEQVAGVTKTGVTCVTPATDVYSLGVILYEMLTGRPPFLSADWMVTLLQIVSEDPPPLRGLASGTPRDLETICLKCLHKEPARRYATAEDLADDLRRFQSGEPIRARPPSLGNRVVRKVRRNPMLATFSAVTLLALAIGVGGITWQWLRADRQWRRAEQAKTDLQVSLDAELAQKKISEQLLYNATISQAVVFWEGGEVQKAREEIATVIPQPGREDLRGWEWYYLERLFHPEAVVVPCDHWVNGIVPISSTEDALAIGLPRFHQFGSTSAADARASYLSWPVGGHPATNLRPGPPLTAGPTGVAVDPCGKLVAWGTADGHVVLSEAGTQRVISSWNLGSDVTSVVFADGGKVLVAGCVDRSARVITLSGTEPVRRPVWPAAPCHVAVAPDGQRIVCFGGWRRVRVHSVRDWSLLGEWSAHEGAVTAATFAADGTLATGGEDGRVVIWNGKSGTPNRTWDAHAGPIYALAFRSEGLTLASAGSDRVIRLWNTSDGKPRGLFRGHTASVRSLCFATDPRWLASGGQDGALRVWDTGQDPRGRRLAFHNRLNGATVDMSGDQMRVRAVSLNGLVANWSVAAGGEKRDDTTVKLTSLKPYPVAYTTFLGAGRLVAGIPADDPKTVAVWASDTGSEVFRAPSGPGRVLTLSTDPRGRRLVWAAVNGERVEVRTWVPEEGGTPSAPLFIPVTFVRAVATTADGSRIAAVASDLGAKNRSSVWLGGLASGQDPFLVIQGEFLAGGLAFSPDGERLAFSINDDIQIVRSDTGVVVSTAAAVGSATCVTFSPDGRRVAAVGYDGVVSLIIPASAKVVFQLRGLAPRRPNDLACDARVAFSPDGRALISTNWDGSINVWNASLVSGSR
jgi:WD40 repeat protein/tRNA A-37 threonylcarbamoyl transferase component Bud32